MVGTKSNAIAAPRARTAQLNRGNAVVRVFTSVDALSDPRLTLITPSTFLRDFIHNTHSTLNHAPTHLFPLQDSREKDIVQGPFRYTFQENCCEDVVAGYGDHQAQEEGSD